MLSECIAGDEESIQLLIRAHQRAVFQVALSILDCSEAPQEETTGQAEIATREAFVSALDQLGRYRVDTPFETWLYGITIQVSQRRGRVWRRERRWRALWWRVTRLFSKPPDPADIYQAMESGEPAPVGHESPAGQERARRDETLWRGVCALKDTLRLPVILRYYHDFPVEQIARMLHTGEGAVHARLDLAREKLAVKTAKA